jgi:hypothetical protein
MSYYFKLFAAKFVLKYNLPSKSFVDNPPLIVFDKIFCILNDCIEIVFVWVILTQISFSSGSSIL